MINLWSKDAVSVAQLMGEAPLDDFENDEQALLADAAAMQAAADERLIDNDAGWDDVIPPMPEDE
jgi:hypothetical protein